MRSRWMLVAGSMVMISGALVLGAPAVWAQNGSVAVTDGYDAAVVNPAALSVGNAAGIAGEIGYSQDTFTEESDAGDTWALFLNGDNLAYAYQELPQSGLHTLAGGANLTTDLYAGIAYRWIPGGFSNGDVRLGGLYRPINAVSTGGTVTFVDEGTTTAVLGLGFRPLFFAALDTHRLTFYTDVPYDGEDWLDPRIGLAATPIDGLELEIGYDVETERFRGAIAFSLSSLRVGNRSRFDSDNQLDTGAAFLHFSPKRFRPIVTNTEDTFVDYAPGPVVVERRSLPDVWPFTEWDSTVSALDVATEIRKMAEDDSVEGILFRKHNFAASSANMLEIQAALEEFRAAGKRVVFYYEGVDNKNYALAASTADQIYLHPGGFVYLTGQSITRPYLEELLDKVGVEVRNFTSGEYKSMGNIYSETAMPESEREALEFILDGLYGEFLRLIEEGRGDRLAASVEETVDAGPYLVAEDALEAGLVDRLLYEDEISDALEELADRPRIRERDNREDIRYAWAESSGVKVALIYVVGPITTGAGRPGEVAGSESVARAIREARQDTSVRAILVRVATGGGSSLASDTIAREIRLAREGEDAKPVVVSMGGTATSGGYYVSAFADEIIAQPTTVTGSIGVVALIPNIEGLSEKLGVNWETLRRGERADLGAVYRRLEPDESQLFQESVDAAYERFVATVAEGRDMSEEAVQEVARGRVWTGPQAQERGLVDTIGGFYSAIASLEERLGGRIELVEYTGQEGFFGSSVPVIDIARGALLGDPRDKLPAELAELLATAEVLDTYGEERVLYLAPYPLEP
ncbi:MAG: signal peptide peptidase SppA [Spirochaetaceae bacterium]